MLTLDTPRTAFGQLVQGQLIRAIKGNKAQLVRGQLVTTAHPPPALTRVKLFTHGAPTGSPKTNWLELNWLTQTYRPWSTGCSSTGRE